MNPPGWLPDDDWRRIQSTMPIPCVDILTTRGGRRKMEVGLIRRQSPNGTRWSHVGGRLLRLETLEAAVHRQIAETLGGVRVVEVTGPVHVAQYFPDGRPGFGCDPRQHAVSLVFGAEIEGEPVAQGEAVEFRWFHWNELPARGDFGFGNDVAVYAAVDRLRG